MSEYQYHEWQAINRVLLPQEQMEVETLSSHIEVNASRAVVTYNWGDFKYDPKQVLLDYFDAYFYCANWGTLQLMFRFPKDLIDENSISPYCDGDMISFETLREYDVLALNFFADGYYPGNGWMKAERGLSGFIRLRDDLMNVDYRLLYLAWLCARTTRDIYDDEEDDGILTTNTELEPPIPAGLKNLSPGLQYFIIVFNVDEYLVQAAAEGSGKIDQNSEVNYRELVSQFSRTECDDFLADLAEGKPGAVSALRKRLSAFMPHKEFLLQGSPRSVQQLADRASQIEKAEEIRLVEEARQRHFAEMKALAQREEESWVEVDQLIATGRRIASVYDEATTKIRKLSQLAAFRQTRPIFQTRIQALGDKYVNRKALIDRWKHEGWLG